MRSSLLRRSLALVALILSAATGTLLPLAHAYGERASVDAVAHVEDPGSSTCPQAHDEQACQLCRVLRLPVTVAASPSVAATKTVALLPGSARDERLPVTRVEPQVSPRAPPQIS